MSDLYNFNFNEDLPAPSFVAAEAVAKEELERLFARLCEANTGWSDPTKGPRVAALGALDAVNAFLKQSPYDGDSAAFSRPLQLLRLALADSPEPHPGEILAPGRKQAPGREKRQAINFINAASVYAVNCLHGMGVKLDAALCDVAQILKAHQFPLGEGAEGAETVKTWRKTYQKKNNAPARFLQSLNAASPIRSPLGEKLSEKDVTAWLERELKHAGFEK